MNFNKNKITLQGKMRGLLMVLFFVGGFLFYNVNFSLAAPYDIAIGGSCVNHTDCDSEFCNNGICAIGGSNCVCRRITNAGGYVTLRPKSNQNTKEACDKYCIGMQGNSYCYNNLVPAFCDSFNVSDTLTSNNPTGVAGPAATVEDLKNRGVQAVTDPVGAAFEAVIKGFLFGLLRFLSMIFGMTGTLFQWLLNPANISGDTGLLNKPAVRDVWIMVRDTLNMVFILILLFGAFCTVFQVEKWSLKKVWLSILINALLVNFSYPIARFFIDVSNVAMYYFLNNMFTGTGQGSGSSIMASFGETSKLSSLLTPDNYQGAEIPYLLAAIIFTFILGMTLFVLAALFVVRLIALVLLVMFSPIGFVGNIFPEMNKFASDWWSNLFKYAFFGPVMVFMMMVSLRIMQAMPNDTWFAAAQANSPADQANWIANSAYYTIPIIILWMAMGISQKMGIAGADKIVGAGQKFGKWGMMKMSGGAFARDTFKAYQARRKQGDAEKLSNRLGKFLGSQQDRLRGNIDPSGSSRGALQARRRYEADAAVEAVAAGKLHDTVNMDDVSLEKLRDGGDKFEKAAARLELAARGKANANDITAMKTEFGDGSILFNQLRNKVKTYDPTAAFATNVDATTGKVIDFDGNRMKEHLNSNQFDPKKLNANSLGNEAFMEAALVNSAISPKELDELASKGGKYAGNIENSLRTVVGRADVAGNHLYSDLNNGDPEIKERNRNIHMAHLAATGEVHTSVPLAQREVVFSKLNKDNAKNLKASTINGNASTIANNISTGQFKDIVSNMKSNTERQLLIQTIHGQASSANVDALKKMIEADPYLKNFVPTPTP